MKSSDPPIIYRQLLKRLRLYYRLTAKLDNHLTAMLDVQEKLIQEISDDLFFLEHSKDEYQKLRKKRH